MTIDSPFPGSTRVLFLNRSYWPDAEATGQLLTELCEDLAAGDFTVGVVAGQPNQNPGNVAFRRSGTEVRNGVSIHRVRHTRMRKSWILGRVINLLTYLFTSALRSLRVGRADVIVVETDPPLLCYLGVLLSVWHRAKLIVYLQDIYPDIAVELGKLRRGLLYRFLHRTMYGAYRRADQVVVLSEDMRDRLLGQGVLAERIAVVPNWVDTRVVHPVKESNALRDGEGWGSDFVVMYSGNLGLSQRLEHLIDAAGMLRDDPGIRFVFIGDGATKSSLVARVRDKGLSNVTFLAYRPKEALAESLSAADVHVVVLDPALSGCMMPSKIYGILASGTAVLVAADERCELSRMVGEHGIGRSVPFGDPVALAESIRWFRRSPSERQDMGRRARDVAVDRYDRRHVTPMFGDILRGVAGTRKDAVSGRSPEDGRRGGRIAGTARGIGVGSARRK